jgi:hypothetical protein
VLRFPFYLNRERTYHIYFSVTHSSITGKRNTWQRAPFIDVREVIIAIFSIRRREFMNNFRAIWFVNQVIYVHGCIMGNVYDICSFLPTFQITTIKIKCIPAHLSDIA